MNKIIIFDHNVLGEKMKKVIVIIIFILGVFLLNKEETIRFRILANSNSKYDQQIKEEVADILKDEFRDILDDTHNISEARTKISNNIDRISNKVDTFLKENGIDYGSNVNFGLNYFPTKEYNGKTYSEGYYESVLVTLGNGEGDNFWCILFPSVCLTDSNTKYESFIKNIIDKILR